MKNFFIGTLLLVCSMCSLFCDAQDNTLWYSKPAADWEHALPVGNGRLGAMVYGGWSRETIQLNEESLWAGSKSEPDADATSTLPEIQRLLLSGRIKEASRLAEKICGVILCVFVLISLLAVCMPIFLISAAWKIIVANSI